MALANCTTYQTGSNRIGKQGLLITAFRVERKYFVFVLVLLYLRLCISIYKFLLLYSCFAGRSFSHFVHFQKCISINTQSQSL